MFIELSGEWWNVDQITKIEPFYPTRSGWDNSEVSRTEIVYVVTSSSGDKRGITEKEFKQIMNISGNKNDFYEK
jgi:hypothetical protein